MTLGEPSGVGDAPQALFDATVTGVGFAPLGASFAADGAGEEQLGVFMQARLIAFEGEHIVRFLFDDARCDRLLRPHRVDGDDRAFDREHVEQFRDRRDLVGFAVDGALRQHEPRCRGVGRH